MPGCCLAENDLVPVVFTWSHSGRQVYITGTFNSWQEQVRLHMPVSLRLCEIDCDLPQIPMFRSGNDFTYIHNLTRGKHVYKFIVDDEWRFAPDQVRTLACWATFELTAYHAFAAHSSRRRRQHQQLH
jgi:hypothetical protein